MLLILYIERKFKKHSEILHFKSLSNTVIRWEKYDEFILELCSLKYAISKKLFLHKCSKFRYYINVNLHRLKKMHKYNRWACQSYCYLSEFTFMLLWKFSDTILIMTSQLLCLHHMTMKTMQWFVQCIVCHHTSLAERIYKMIPDYVWIAWVW